MSLVIFLKLVRLEVTVMNTDLFIEFICSTHLLMWKFGLFCLFLLLFYFIFFIIFTTLDDHYFSLLETILFVGLSYDML